MRYSSEEERREAARLSRKRYEHTVSGRAMRTRISINWQHNNPKRVKKIRQKVHHKRWMRNKKFMDRVVLKFGCSVCGYRGSASALEFHHNDPKVKNKAVRALSTRPMKMIKNEMRKCIILCANCHREQHYPYVKSCRLRARRFVNRVAQFFGCQKCGYKRSIAAIDFHHRDPKNKILEVRKMSDGCTVNAIKIEIRKCNILCANCHREVHEELRRQI